MQNHLKAFGAKIPLPTEGEGIKRHYRNAFTLAELLIALAILGVIATFTIPKILDSGTNSQWSAVTKEDIAAISGAFMEYKRVNGISATTRIDDLTPYLNYVRYDTTATGRDSFYGMAGERFCNDDGNERCLIFHNGSLMRWQGMQLVDTSSTSALLFLIDPDGKITEAGSPANGNGKGIFFLLYANGRLTTRSQCVSGTKVVDIPALVCPSTVDPPWFSWSN